MSHSITDVLREAYEIRRDSLIEEYEALNDQLTQVRDEVDRIRIKRSLEKKESEIRLVEEQSKQLDSPATFELEQALSLQAQIASELELPLLLRFGEYIRQIDSHLNRVALLYEELEEWKELHHLLHDLYFQFLVCHTYAAELEKLANSPVFDEQTERVEKLLSETEVNWRGCKRNVHKAKVRAKAVRRIGIPYDEDTGQGPEWYLELAELRETIDQFFLNFDFTSVGIVDLARDLISFHDVTEEWLLIADDNLRKVAQQINRQQILGAIGIRK